MLDLCPEWYPKQGRRRGFQRGQPWLLVGIRAAVHARSCSSAALLMEWPVAAPLQRCWPAHRAGALTATASETGHRVIVLQSHHLHHGLAAETGSTCSQVRFRHVL